MEDKIIPNLIEIKNNPPATESIIALIIATVTIPLATYMILEKILSNQIIALSLSIALMGIVMPLGLRIISLKKKRSKLVINPEEKTFSLDEENFYPFESLKYFKSTMLQTPPFLLRFLYQTRMSIIFGINEKQTITLIDNAGSFFGSKGISPDALEALSLLMDESSISDESKLSFSNWYKRSQIISN